MTCGVRHDEDQMKQARTKKKRGPTEGVRVRKGKSQIMSAVGADRKTSVSPSGIAVHGGMLGIGEMPSTYPLGPDPFCGTGATAVRLDPREER